jgi:hypothetical protein
MAETLTYDPGSDTVTSEGNLTPDEQESMKIGEELVDQQQQLLAGKYKNAEDLEKAYVELQKKLGGEGAEDSETTGDTKSSDDGETSEETEETKEDTEEFYLEDGKVNYEYVNKEYGEQLGDVFKNSNVDPWAISKHFHENEGTITEDMYGELENAGLARQTVDAYLSGRAVEAGYNTDTVPDLTEKDINTVRDSIGGEEEYNKVINWASENLAKSEVDSFDDLVGTGNVGAIKLAVNGLKAQYETANGYEGRMLAGKAPSTSNDVYKSQAQLVEAMSDPRYDRDPAYRQDVIEKLDRSDLQF